MGGEALPFRHEELSYRLKTLESRISNLERALYLAKADNHAGWMQWVFPLPYHIPAAATDTGYLDAAVAGFNYTGGNVLVATGYIYIPSGELFSHGLYNIQLSDGVNSTTTQDATNNPGVAGAYSTYQVEWIHPWRSVLEDRALRLGSQKAIPPGRLLRWRVRRVTGNFAMDMYMPVRLIWSTTEQYPNATTSGAWSVGRGVPPV